MATSYQYIILSQYIYSYAHLTIGAEESDDLESGTTGGCVPQGCRKYTEVLWKRSTCHKYSDICPFPNFSDYFSGAFARKFTNDFIKH